MEMSDTIEFAAGVEEVFAMLTDEEFQDWKCFETKAIAHEVNIRQAGAHTIIGTRRTLPTDNFPDFVRSIVGNKIVIVQEDTWHPAGPDGSRRGTISVHVQSIPLRLHGTLLLTPTATGTHEEIIGDLRASIPLIGSKIEKAAMPAVESAVRAERRVGHAWLTSDEE